jgi:hypothetical protein
MPFPNDGWPVITVTNDGGDLVRPPKGRGAGRRTGCHPVLRINYSMPMTESAVMEVHAFKPTPDLLGVKVMHLAKFSTPTTIRGFTDEDKALALWVAVFRDSEPLRAGNLPSHLDRAGDATNAVVRREADTPDGLIGVRLAHLVNSLTLPGGPLEHLAEAPMADRAKRAAPLLGWSEDRLAKYLNLVDEHMAELDLYAPTRLGADLMIRRATDLKFHRPDITTSVDAVSVLRVRRLEPKSL